MSFLYYTDDDPQTNAVFKNIKANNVFQKNPETGIYERVGTGGGSGVDLPYWALANSVGMHDAREEKFLEADPTKVNVANVAKQEEVTINSDKILFTDSAGDSILDKSGVSLLNNLKPAVATNMDFNHDSRVLLYDTTDSKYKSRPWSNFLFQKRIDFESDGRRSQLDNSGIRNGFRAINVGNSTYLNDSELGFGSSQPGFSNLDLDRAYALMTRERLSFNPGTLKPADPATLINNSGMTVRLGARSEKLDFDSIYTANRLRDAPLKVTPASSDRMLLFDPDAKNYSYTTIPNGSTTPTISTIPFNQGDLSLLGPNSKHNDLFENATKQNSHFGVNPTFKTIDLPKIGDKCVLTHTSHFNKRHAIGLTPAAGKFAFTLVKNDKPFVLLTGNQMTEIPPDGADVNPAKYVPAGAYTWTLYNPAATMPPSDDTVNMIKYELVIERVA